MQPEHLISTSNALLWAGIMIPLIISWQATRRENRKMHEERQEQDRKMHTENQVRFTAIETQMETQLEPIAAWFNNGRNKT